MVWLNSQNVRDLRTPFGGVKASGLGREGGPPQPRLLLRAPDRPRGARRPPHSSVWRGWPGSLGWSYELRLDHAPVRHRPRGARRVRGHRSRCLAALLRRPARARSRRPETARRALPARLRGAAASQPRAAPGPGAAPRSPRLPGPSIPRISTACSALRGARLRATCRRGRRTRSGAGASASAIPSGSRSSSSTRWSTSRLHLWRYDLYRGARLARVDHCNLFVPDVPLATTSYYRQLGFRCSEYIASDPRRPCSPPGSIASRCVHDVAFTTGAGPRLHHFAFSAMESAAVIRLCEILRWATASIGSSAGPGRHGVSNAFYVYLRTPTATESSFHRRLLHRRSRPPAASLEHLGSSPAGLSGPPRYPTAGTRRARACGHLTAGRQTCARRFSTSGSSPRSRPAR